jgi:hypothetical protein
MLFPLGRTMSSLPCASASNGIHRLPFTQHPTLEAIITRLEHVSAASETSATAQAEVDPEHGNESDVRAQVLTGAPFDETCAISRQLRHQPWTCFAPSEPVPTSLSTMNMALPNAYLRLPVNASPSSLSRPRLDGPSRLLQARSTSPPRAHTVTTHPISTLIPYNMSTRTPRS